MKDEVLKQYLGKWVRVTFYDNEVVGGRLGEHDTRFVSGWKGTGYHIGDLGFKKSHVKKIEELK